MIRELEKEFIGKGEVKGFKFTQIKKNDYAYLYEVSHPTFFARHYEVFKKKINFRYGCITYPKSKSFGVFAWSIKTYDKALEKFEEITIHEMTKEAQNG